MLSIIIPTFNRGNTLRKTLKTITELDVDFSLLEVIIVDNGSTDQTAIICKEFINKNSNIKTRYVYDPVPGLLTGRHAGAFLASGDILAFIDDDVELSRKWAKSILKTIEERPEVKLLTGPNLPKYESYPPDWLDNFWIQLPDKGCFCGALSLLDLGNENKYIDPTFVWGLNFIIRKEIFNELKGFHPDTVPKGIQFLQGDGETGLSIKAKDKGYKAYYDSGIMVYHFVPDSRMTFDYFEKRFYFQGVADSFTELRRRNGLYKKNDIGENEIPLMRKLKNSLKKNYFNLKKEKIGYSRDKVNNIFEKCQEKYKEGFTFHQTFFEKNSVVHDWVLRTDYLDYMLPDKNELFINKNKEK
jgi:glycosyltransferase involved in cell wall biosynthesis